MSAFYNEIDPYTAQWLRNLIAAGHIADGVVDTRSISNILPEDLREFSQCHFFAGIGVWSHALRLAKWPDSRPVWTGSCPCQPFSVAGAHAGVLDERHLWPHWFWLIEQCRPAVVFGEQVEASIRHGWLDLVQADMEGIGYAVAAAGIPAAGVGAPHIRQRLWFVADDDGLRFNAGGVSQNCDAQNQRNGSHAGQQGQHVTRGLREADGVDHHHHPRLEGLGGGHQAAGGRVGALRSVAASGEPCLVADIAGQRRSGLAADTPQSTRRGGVEVQGTSGGMADVPAAGRGLVGRGGFAGAGDQGPHIDLDPQGRRPGPTNGHWGSADWLHCRDGRWRPVESGTFPLAHGVASRVGRLRAYGNAIVPQVAKEVIAAYMACRP